jgi:hypothetical protein
VKLSDREIIYFIEAVGSGHIKIGYTNKILDRLSILQCGNHLELDCIAFVDGDKQSELFFHGAFCKKRVRGEWFKITHLEVLEAIGEYKNSEYYINLRHSPMDDVWKFLFNKCDEIKNFRLL